MPKLRVLISEPNAPGEIFLPYVWAILKSYWERHAVNPDVVEWLEPIYLRNAVRAGLESSAIGSVDVLGLSCYTWNWALNCEIAQWMKSNNPDCVVVAGGPDPDYKDPDFFKKHPYIDVIVVKDGEIPFMKILEAIARGERDFRQIPGLYLPASLRIPSPEGTPLKPHLYTGATEVPRVFDHSPYLDQTAYYESIMANRGQRYIMATLETNRGCPYSCNYCDWGSSTMSKLRRFEMERVEREIDWLGKIGVDFIMLADANFGILPRDIEIADMIARTRLTYGHPRQMYYSSAKNNPDRTVEVTKRFYQAGLINHHTLSVQHTDAGVLAMADRSNIPVLKYREVVSKLAQYGIPCEVQLIFGIPSDTLEKWKDCLAEMMDWGVHDNFQISPYALLPNAPASDPVFLDRWQVETVTRGLIPYSGIRFKNLQVDITKSIIIVSFKGFTRENWVEGSTYSALVKALHNCSLTLLPALYLRYVHDVPYRTFYDAVIHDFIQKSPEFSWIYDRVRTVYAAFLENDDLTDEMELEDFPECPFVVDPAKWVLVKCCLNLDAFYDALLGFLRQRFSSVRNLKSVVEYQKNLVVLPDYHCSEGKSFVLDRDWPAFFETAGKLTEYRKLDEPAPFFLPRVAVLAEKDRNGKDNMFDFEAPTAHGRWLRWLRQLVCTSNMARYTIGYSVGGDTDPDRRNYRVLGVAGFHRPACMHGWHFPWLFPSPQIFWWSMKYYRWAIRISRKNP